MATIVDIEIEGVSPLLMDRMDDATLESLRTGVRIPTPKDIPAKDVAAKKVYNDENGETGIPPENLFSCLKLAGRRVKNGAKQISTADTTTLPALLSIQSRWLSFNGTGSDWKVDKRRGQLPKDGTAVCLVRPRFDKWGFAVTIEIDDREVNETTVKELFRVAGSFIGLCGFRPACGGPFGRFRVKSWKSQKIG